ncbi:MAG: hypothetical protein R3C53_14370 [Pirellulaceae bacterium]
MQQAVMHFVTDRNGRIIVCSIPEPLGARIPTEYSPDWERLQNGQAIIIRPHRSPWAVPNMEGEPELGVPIILVASPILVSERVAGALCFALRPEGRFSDVLEVARSGTSGETYAIDRDSLMLSSSRFETALREVGMLEVNGRSSLNIAIRNPGGDRMQGYVPEGEPLADPMTEAAAGISAASRSDRRGISHQITPYRDYRGVYVVGAWQWLPEYQFGVITEVDSVQAFAPVRLLRNILWSLLALLAATLFGIFAYSSMMSSVLRRLNRAERKLEKLGQYELLEKVGSGGMGEVYRARHAMLLRDTAVKLLRPSIADAWSDLPF